ncbi:MAG: hypothetical protein M3Z46_01735 [Actinomycetota bacterium]|nr:hypothetical protein [Actinomycetota bacterium]
MSDYTIPDPEPKEIDEKLSIELRHLTQNAVLKGTPSGEEKCENCLYYLEPTASLSYCWHPKLRILVGAEWWCQWWEKIPEDA